MSEALPPLCLRLVEWLEPRVGRDLGLERPAVESFVRQRVLPRLRAIAPDPEELGAPGGQLLEAILPREHEAEPCFVGRGRVIHRDLGGFMRARLDEHLRRELLDLDALDRSPPDEAVDLRERLARARARRALGRELAAVLAALEDGRRARWARPKLVLGSRWCISLGLVPAALHPEILAQAAQRRRWWEQLGLDASALEALPPAQRRHLVVDTRWLEPSLAERVVAGLPPERMAAASLAIRADNLDALRLLERAGIEAQCIFIDPPYNTGGNDFIYDDLYPGGSWAVMMGDRLALARQRLVEDGVLVATIDDGEVATLRRLLERAFGPENFVTQAVWHKKYARQNDATWFSSSHDHVLVAARDKARWRPRRIPRSTAQNKGYRNPDGDPRGPWQSVVYTCNKTAEQRPNLYYPIVHPHTGQEVWPERNRVWAFSPQAHARNEAEGRVWWGREGQRDKPRQKVFLRDVDRGMVPDTLWTRDRVGDNQDAQRELAALFGTEGGSCTPKPVRLLQHVLTLGSSPGDTVLDFFAGSGTTAHAALELERTGDGPPRRFVMVEAGETFESVLVPRLEKVAFARDWEGGRPTGGEGLELACRVLALESYDDALEELRVSPDPLGRLLDGDAPGPWPLPAGALADPFDCRPLRRGGEAGGAPLCVVDAFAFLLGLRVESLSPTVARHGTRSRAMWGRDPQGRRVLVLWRTLHGEPERDAEVARTLLREHLVDVASLDLLYLDGAHDPEEPALRRTGARVEPIEATFRRRLAGDPRDHGAELRPA